MASHTLVANRAVKPRTKTSGEARRQVPNTFLGVKSNWRLVQIAILGINMRISMMPAAYNVLYVLALLVNGIFFV